MAVAQDARPAYPVLREASPFTGSRFLVPNTDERRPAVVMLHGSEGGSEFFLEPEAAVLASQGHAVLVLCYFDCNRGIVGTRQTLKDIDTALVLRAVAWLRALPTSDGRVTVYGFSRGGELALIAGSLQASPDEKPSALIAHTPSDVFNSSFNWSWRDPVCWLCRRGIGRCATNAPRSEFDWNPSCGPDDERRMNFATSAWIVDGQSVPSGTRIPIENYDGPILITVGEKDELWPVSQTNRIEATLRAAGRSPEVRYFPNGGHLFGRADENTRREIVLDFLKRIPVPAN